MNVNRAFFIKQWYGNTKKKKRITENCFRQHLVTNFVIIVKRAIIKNLTVRESVKSCLTRILGAKPCVLLGWKKSVIAEVWSMLPRASMGKNCRQKAHMTVAKARFALQNVKELSRSNLLKTTPPFFHHEGAKEKHSKLVANRLCFMSVAFNFWSRLCLFRHFPQAKNFSTLFFPRASERRVVLIVVNCDTQDTFSQFTFSHFCHLHMCKNVFFILTYSDFLFASSDLRVWLFFHWPVTFTCLIFSFLCIYPLVNYHNYGKSPFSGGKIHYFHGHVNNNVSHYQGVNWFITPSNYRYIHHEYS